MTYELTEEKVELINNRLLKAYRRGTGSIEDELMQFLEEEVENE
jgi:hypothetical protein